MDQAPTHNATIYILKSKPETLRAAEDHLHTLGWKVESSTDVKSAIAAVQKLKPSFFLISIENSFPSLKTLPTLIMQAFPETRVILFADTSTPQNLTALKAAPTEHTLYPPVSGSSIERLISRIVREREKPSDETSIQIIDTGDRSAKDQALKTLSVLASTMTDTEYLDYINGKANSELRVVTEPAVSPDFANKEVKRMADATEKALESSASPDETGDGERIGFVKRVACISVQSKALSGYLIAAYGENRDIDTEFLNKVRQRLVELMHLEDQSFTADSQMDLELTEVQFEDWAIQQGEFLKRTIHFGHEVAIAFFPPQAPQPELESSGSDHMLMIEMNEIVANAPVDFDLYVYLPANRKYVLYTRQGEAFPADQRERLIAKGVTRMHLPRDTQSEVRRYRARNYLNSKIKALKEARPAA